MSGAPPPAARRPVFGEDAGKVPRNRRDDAGRPRRLGSIREERIDPVKLF